MSTEQEVQEQARQALAKIEAGQPAQAEQKQPCPRCDYLEGARPKPQKADMEEFTRAVLGGRPYRKEYKLVDGKIRMEFDTLATDTADVLDRMLIEMADMPQLGRQTLGIKLKLVFHLRSLTLGPDKKTFDAPALGAKLSDIEGEYVKRFGQISDPVIQMAGRTLLLFLDLQQLMLHEAFDENFWKGAGPY